MWIATPIGFFSAVQKPDESRLSIRARAASDLDRLRQMYLPSLSATERWPGADYPFRAFANHFEWANAVGQMAEEIDYANFKSEVRSAQGPNREAAYHKVWAALLDLERADQMDLDWRRRLAGLPDRAAEVPEPTVKAAVRPKVPAKVKAAPKAKAAGRKAVRR